jgi:hypothetical protein
MKVIVVQSVAWLLAGRHSIQNVAMTRGVVERIAFPESGTEFSRQQLLS